MIERVSQSALTPTELRLIFLAATQNLVDAAHRWQSDGRFGRTDEEIAKRLRFELGVYGGQSPCSGTSEITVEYQADGLKIWASRNGLARHRYPPVVQGQATIAMARETYGIANPGEPQLQLF